MKTVKPELVIYRENKTKVLNYLKDGRIDYVDSTSWDFVDRFFAFLISTKFFEYVSSKYPTPRKKHEVPVWFLISCLIQQKLFCKHSFSAIPGVLKSGAILSRIKFNIGLKMGGFNNKNKNPRRSPVDFDTVRKFFKDTDSKKLIDWFNNFITGWFRNHRGIDKEGIFILDSSKLPIPDNPRYENVGYLPIDERGNYIELEQISKQKTKLKYKACYKLSTLLHISSRANYFLYTGIRLGPGTNADVEDAKKIVERFVNVNGKGIIKWIIFDRGYIDGKLITNWKTQYKIDTLMPLRKNMGILKDAIGLSKLSESGWQDYVISRDKEGNITKRERVIAVKELEILG